MAPDAEDCETATLSADYDYNVPVHQGRRVLPELAAPTLAWVECEDGERCPAESRRLLPSPADKQKHKSRLQAGLTLGVHSKYPHKSSTSKKQEKTKFQKRKEKLIEVLKPPYFILTMIIIIVGIHLFGSKALRAKLEWLPATWKQEPWRMFTYGLVHASHAHLALNALVALAVGWRLEREQGWWRVMCVWWGGVCAGALGAGALQPLVKVVGASAAVYALLTAHLPNVCLRFGYIPLWWFRPLSVVVLFSSEGCWALMRASSEHGGGAARAHVSYDHVAWSAHVLGAAIGVPLAFLVFKGENIKKSYIVGARVLSAAAMVSGIVFATLYYTYCADGEET